MQNNSREEMTSFENIKYDELIRVCENSWLLKVDDKKLFFPFAICDLDDKSKVILCPYWFIIQEELENYIDE